MGKDTPYYSDAVRVSCVIGTVVLALSYIAVMVYHPLEEWALWTTLFVVLVGMGGMFHMFSEERK